MYVVFCDNHYYSTHLSSIIILNHLLFHSSTDLSDYTTFITFSVFNCYNDSNYFHKLKRFIFLCLNMFCSIFI